MMSLMLYVCREFVGQIQVAYLVRERVWGLTGGTTHVSVGQRLPLRPVGDVDNVAVLIDIRLRWDTVFRRPKGPGVFLQIVKPTILEIILRGSQDGRSEKSVSVRIILTLGRGKMLRAICDYHKRRHVVSADRSPLEIHILLAILVDLGHQVVQEPWTECAVLRNPCPRIPGLVELQPLVHVGPVLQRVARKPRIPQWHAGHGEVLGLGLAWGDIVPEEHHHHPLIQSVNIEREGEAP